MQNLKRVSGDEREKLKSLLSNSKKPEIVNKKEKKITREPAKVIVLNKARKEKKIENVTNFEEDKLTFGDKAKLVAKLPANMLIMSIGLMLGRASLWKVLLENPQNGFFRTLKKMPRSIVMPVGNVIAGIWGIGGGINRSVKETVGVVTGKLSKEDTGLVFR